MRTAVIAAAAALVAVFLTLFACSPASRPEPEGGGVRAAPGKQQWEYKVVIGPQLERGENFYDKVPRLEELMNKMAADGWEYVENLNMSTALVFRRPK